MLKSLLVLTATALLMAGCATTGSTSSTAKTKSYPLDTCIVTDNELASMGRPITKVYDWQTVKFCCKPCVREFEENPSKFLPKIKKS